MQQPIASISYKELNAQLAVSDISPSVAEAQGILCGMMCVDEPQAEAHWMAELLPGADGTDPSIQTCRRSLHDLAAHTRREFSSPDVLFTPLLPDESLPLAERARGLYDYSRGFLYGLGLAALDADRLPGQAKEAFDDIASVTHLDLDDLDDSEDNERALTELTEFVRVATMLVYEEYIGAVEASE